MHDSKNTVTVFLERYIHLLILGGAGMISLGALFALSKFDASRLNAFGPTAKLYFSGIKSGLLVSTGILLFSFIAALFFKKYADALLPRLKSFFASRSESKKNILILGVCMVFAFGAHAGNIMNGYFNMDDFEVMGLIHSVPFGQALLTPHGNDHTIPLFTLEMKILDALFGENPIPYNIFIFILFALIPFFTYLSFKKLGLGLKSFAVFLILFTGATGWDDMLTGFYIMSIYFQIILFFSVSVWAYLSWQEVHEKKYLLFLALSMTGALGSDISGVWVIPAIILVMAFHSHLKNDTCAIQKKHVVDFFVQNKKPLAVVGGVAVIFTIFLAYTFMVIQPDTFLSALSDSGVPSADEKEQNWKLIPLAENFLSLFASGASLTLLAPKITKILTHPSIKTSVQNYWPFVEILVLLLNAALFWFTLKYAEMKEKKLIFLLLGVGGIAILMVIIARPNHEPIPDFDYRYAGAAFYAYCFFLALSASVFLKTKKDFAVKIIAPLVIIIFSAQQAFSFQAIRTKEEAGMRRAAVEKVNENLLSELENISKKKNDGLLMVPNLNGGHIFEQTLAGFTLSYYVLFFNRHMPVRLIQNAEMPQDKTHGVIGVSSLRASTSPEFINALKEHQDIRSYYLSPGLMSYNFITGSSTVPLVPNTKKEILIQEKAFDPEKIHTVDFTLVTDTIPGNVELAFSFKNDFGIEGPAGKIRVDDFTPYETKDGKRIYHIKTDLLQLYAYALSEKISNLALSVPDAKHAQVTFDFMDF